jgi:hypothetical protein
MSAAPPSYSTISLCDPPDYFTAVENRPISPPPPYVDPTGSFGTSRHPATELPPAPAEVHRVEHCIKNWCALIWILFTISLALMHFVLFFICFKCSLPKSSLGAIRALFFLYILFLVGMVICCWDECKHRGALTASDGVVATFVCVQLPTYISIFVFFPLIISDMTELNEAIQSSVTVTKDYPCSLSFYKLVFGLVISDYIAIPVSILFIIMYAYVRSSPRCKLYLNSINTQGGPRNTQVQPRIQAEPN